MAVSPDRVPGELTDEEKEQDPLSLAKKIRAEGRAFPKAHLSTGDQDFLFDAITAFRDELRKLDVDLTYDEMAGFGHEWAFWDIQIKEFMEWLPRTDAYALEGSKRKI